MLFQIQKSKLLSEIAGAKVHLFSRKKILAKIFLIFFILPFVQIQKNADNLAIVLIFCLALQPQQNLKSK